MKKRTEGSVYKASRWAMHPARYRVLALLLCLAMVLSVWPATAHASGADSGSSESAEGSEGSSSGSASDDGNTSGGTSDTWVATNAVGNTDAVSGGSTVTNTYILEVSSGTRSGGGYADNVQYFMISYTDKNGTKRTSVIMPQEDGVERGFEVAASVGSRSSRRHDVKELFGYTTVELKDAQTLGSVTTDQFLFTTPEAIKTVDRIQIFGGRTEQPQTEWNCQGMRVCRVDKLIGLDIYGWYSDKGYIDYEGEIIAEIIQDDGAGTFYWATSGGVYTIATAGADNGAAGIELANGVSGPKYNPSQSEDDGYEDRRSHVGMTHTKQGDKNVYFEIDLADQGNAGLEALESFYENGAEPKLSQMGLCECGVVTVRYRDVFGNARVISLPLAINAIGPIAESMGNVAIAGYAQQGETIVIPMMLPDFASLIQLKINLSEKAGVSTAHLVDCYDETEASKEANAKVIRDRRKSKTTDDGISYLHLAFYDDVDVKVGQEGATIKYNIEPGTKNPIAYTTAGSIDGVEVPTTQETAVSFQDYDENMVWRPKDRMDRYLVTVSTDDVVNAGTGAKLLVQFNYINMKDREIVSDPYDVNEYVTMFYGEWPGSVDNFAYRYGLRQGGTMQFMIPLMNVKKFTGVSFKIEGGDEWQVSGVSIAKVKKYYSRVGHWQEINVIGSMPDGSESLILASHLRYSRKVETDSVAFEVGTVRKADTDGGGSGSGGSGGGSGGSGGGSGGSGGTGTTTPGTLVQDDGEWTIISGDGSEVSKKEDVDWSQLIHYMTYEDTRKNLGFTKERKKYKVSVKVFGDRDNLEDDDCGSANLFYFQLVFESGTSGITMANQQIMGDAFRTGSISEFYIPCSQNYGDVVAINVIPDDQDDNSNIYDKMKIEYIEVELQTSEALSPVWKAKGDAKDGLGWVGIEYRDPTEGNGLSGSAGRSMAEIATTYQITESDVNARLMISITTGPYGTSQKVPQFSGGLAMDFSYYNTEGKLRWVRGFDVVKAMNEYSGKTGSKTRTITQGSLNGEVTTTEEMDFYVSDPDYQFRASRSDNFFITVSDVSRIVSMKLYVYSSRVTNWTITDVKCYLVNAAGRRYINMNGEYDYAYPVDEGLTFVGSWNRNGQSLTKGLTIYRPRQDNAIDTINIQFEENDIEVDKGSYTWKSLIPRVPSSSNDTVNVYIYPQTTGNGVTDPENYGLTAAVQYTDAMTRRTAQVSAGRLDVTYDVNGKMVYYVLGLGAGSMDSIYGVTVAADSRNIVYAPIEYGILQRIRGGVLIESYRLYGIPNAEYGGTMTVQSELLEGGKTTRLFLEIPRGVEEQTVEEGKADMAVAVYFTTLAGQELRSQYAYLSDVCDSIHGGQVVELDYDLGEISEITAINIVRIGNLFPQVDGIYVADQNSDGSVDKEWSLDAEITPGTAPTRVDTRGSVTLLTIKTETAEDEASLSSGTTGPIWMKIGYIDQYGELQSKEYQDIRPYVVSTEVPASESGSTENPKAFSSGGTDTVQLTIPGLESVRWVELEPQHDSSMTVRNPDGTISTMDASWKLHKISMTTGLDGPTVTRTLDQRLYEDSPVNIFMADILMSGLLSVNKDGKTIDAEVIGSESTTNNASSGSADKDKELTIHSGEKESIIVDSGAQARVTVRISGSAEGFDVKLQQVEDDSVEDEPDLDIAGHGYDDDYLAELMDLAWFSKESDASDDKEKKAAQEVYDIVSAMREAEGMFTYDDSRVIFTPPRNYSDGRNKYRITISSKENSELKFTVDITVRQEANNLQKALETWNAVRVMGEYYTSDEMEVLPIVNGEEKTILLESGSSLLIHPRVLRSQGYSTVVSGYEPSTKATGKAVYSATGYTEAALASYKAQANSILSSDRSTESERSAAQNVLDVIAAMEAGTGSFTYNEEESYSTLTAPHNYTGSNLYYHVQVNNAQGTEKMFTFIVSVKSEKDPLPAAISAMDSAVSGGNTQRSEEDRRRKESEEEAQRQSEEEAPTQSEEESRRAEEAEAESGTEPAAPSSDSPSEADGNDSGGGGIQPIEEPEDDSEG